VTALNIREWADGRKQHSSPHAPTCPSFRTLLNVDHLLQDQGVIGLGVGFRPRLCQ